MYREINPPDEIVKRLLFVLYLALVVVSLVMFLIGLVQRRFDYLRLSMLAGAAAFVMSRFGGRRLDFDRLAASFPHGEEMQRPDGELRLVVESLLAEATDAAGNWQMRQGVRKRLLAMLEKHPELWQEFSSEIDAVFPALGEWVGRGRLR